MTREEEILKEAKVFAEEQCMALIKPDDEYAFEQGAKWADAHPHWISVEDELPPRWDTNPNVSVPAMTFGYLGESSIAFIELQRYHFGDGRWEYGDATHWMPFQYPEKGDEQ